MTQSSRIDYQSIEAMATRRKTQFCWLGPRGPFSILEAEYQARSGARNAETPALLPTFRLVLVALAYLTSRIARSADLDPKVLVHKPSQYSVV